MESKELITQEIKVKGMICSRCIKVLKMEFKTIGVEVIDIHLGEIIVRYNPHKITLTMISQLIKENEFELISDEQDILSEQIKILIIEWIWNTKQGTTLSNFLTKKIGKNYSLLSKIFSKRFGKTIERYGIILKMERAKESIESGQLSFSQIAYSLGYQNLSALSRQFKRETGLTLKDYKKLDVGNRIALDKIR